MQTNQTNRLLRFWRPAVQLLRPYQWVKSLFVLLGLLFSHAWSELALRNSVLLATVAFALAASAVYVFNDLNDREQDRAHPQKSKRPLAAGTVRVRDALWLGLLCLFAALFLAYQAAPLVCLIIVAYLLLNLAYSLALKHIVLLDVFVIATGFMLRILAGTLGVGIAPSHWLLLCGLMLTLLLGFAKRRAELKALAQPSRAQRKVLAEYDLHLLDQIIAVCAACTIISYGLYTVSAETLLTQGTDHLIYTVPFVVYGVFRYLFLLHRRTLADDPSSALLRDRHLLFSCLGWLLSVLLIIF
ncbi:MAG: decaprenyl-phosphate phosphoribosyltransferase [Pseudomonadota bacterium]